VALFLGPYQSKFQTTFMSILISKNSYDTNFLEVNLQRTILHFAFILKRTANVVFCRMFTSRKQKYFKEKLKRNSQAKVKITCKYANLFEFILKLFQI
jgi:hypothetical protein